MFIKRFSYIKEAEIIPTGLTFMSNHLLLQCSIFVVKADYLFIKSRKLRKYMYCFKGTGVLQVHHFSQYIHTCMHVLWMYLLFITVRLIVLTTVLYSYSFSATFQNTPPHSVFMPASLNTRLV